MKIILLTVMVICSTAYGLDKKTEEKKVVRDFGDTQLLKRDACRKPTEAMESKYEDLSKDEIRKLKEKCEYQAPD